jgi:hypothetical protein
MIDENTSIINFLSKHKIYYMHLVDSNNVEDIIIGGSTCTSEELALFILYNLSVKHSEDVLVSLNDNKVSLINGKEVLESYIRLTQDQLAKFLEKENKPLDNLEEPIINPLDVYSNAKVIK